VRARELDHAALPHTGHGRAGRFGPRSPAVANAGAGIRGWLATIAGLLALGTQTQAKSASVTIATDLTKLEPGGVKITAAAMLAGGIGLPG